MKPIKKRWHMWKHYTNKYDKALHGAMALLATLHIVGAAIAPNLASWSAAGIFTWLTCTFILKDVWGNAYQKTETLRALGWHVTDQLHKWSFINITKSGASYHIEPDNPAEDPDEADDAMFTHEIVIRLGMDSEGEEITAYRIPGDMGLSSVVGALESVKLQYSYDVVGEDDE